MPINFNFADFTALDKTHFPCFHDIFYSENFVIETNHLNQRWVRLFQPALIKKRGTKRATRRHRGAFEGIFLRLQVGSVAENRWWTCAAVQPQTLTFLTGSTSPSSKGSSLSLPFFSSASQRSSVSSCRKKNRCGVGAKSKGRYRVSTLHPL